jgi:hypothetical protein
MVFWFISKKAFVAYIGQLNAFLCSSHPIAALYDPSL